MATLLSDTFTDSNGTALSAHTMDVGSGWTAHAGTWLITSNGARMSSNTLPGAATADAGAADVTISCDITPEFSTNRRPGLVFRYVDASNFWFVRVQPNINEFELYEVTGGTETLRDNASVATSVGVSFACQVVLSGTSISATINGGNTVSATSASHQTATRHGLYGFRSQFGLTHDNFLVTGAGGASIAPLAMAHYRRMRMG